ncbi:PREDICTED: basic proline-rich protein-like [Chinchilla lanigera]|uniref:basic proline-rich protein-like n=1 Tax=Chinchilla lanigera TaxID=34839 RepID=UPI0006973D63|nr:PREDICTED: basic proline-rich protein-like [Chinchilla lanigera]
MFGRSRGSWSKDQSPGPHQARVPSAAGSVTKTLSASSPAAILAPGTAAGSLRAPRTLQTRPAFFHCPERPAALAAPRLQDPHGDAPPLPTAPSFFPEGRLAAPSLPSRRAAAHPVLGGGWLAGGGRGGVGRGSPGCGGAAEGGAGARGLGATFLFATLPHAESTEVAGALEGVAGGWARARARAQTGDHTGEPARALPAASVPRGVPHPTRSAPAPGSPPPRLPPPPTPGCEAPPPHFPKPTGAPRLHPRPFPARPHPAPPSRRTGRSQTGRAGRRSRGEAER